MQDEQLLKNRTDSRIPLSTLNSALFLKLNVYEQLDFLDTFGVI